MVTLNRFEGVFLDKTFMAHAKELSKPKGERKMVKAASLGLIPAITWPSWAWTHSKRR